MRLLSVAFALIALPAVAALPQYNLYLTDLSKDISTSGTVKVNAVPAYINQPTFSADGKRLFFTLEQGKDAALQTDIGTYSIAEKKQQLLTKTALSEYSPTLMPDGAGLSVVVVEADQTQRLWAMDWQGNTHVLKPQPKGVGYHAWGPDQDLLLFILGDKDDNHTVRYLDKSGQLSTIATGVGRALNWQPGTQQGFFTILRNNQLFVSFIDVPTKQQYQTALALPSGGQDLLWWSADTLLVSAGSKIYQWQTQGKQGAALNELAKTQGWSLWLDLSKECDTEISRFALNKARSQLAFVCKA